MINLAKRPEKVENVTKLAGLTPLREKVSIYVPSTQNVDIVTDNSVYVEKIMIALSNMFGGSTKTEGLGSYVADNGSLVVEKVDIIYAYSTQISNNDIDKIVELCEMLKSEMLQECISLELNGELYFI